MHCLHQTREGQYLLWGVYPHIHTTIFIYIHIEHIIIEYGILNIEYMVCTQLPYPCMCNMSCKGHNKNLVCVPTATVPLLAVRKRVCDYVYLLLRLQCCVVSPAYVQFLEI